MKISKILAAFGLATAVSLGAVSVTAQEDEVRIATGWHHSFNYELGQGEAGFITFPFTNPIEYTDEMKLNLPEHYDMDQPVKVGNYYYFYMFAVQIYGYDAIGFYRYDIEDQSLKLIADYGATANGTAFSKLCYDYTDGTMYCVDRYMGYRDLSILDLETGIHKKQCEIKVPLDLDHPNFEDHVMALAINYDGEMYGLTYWGHIVKINKFTGECRVISTMDYNPDGAFMYAGEMKMFFDHETGDCYLDLYTFGGKSEIRKIDLTTGHSEQFAPMPSQVNNIYGIDVPFKAAEPSAPGKVTNLSIEVAPKGKCEATLTWTNPVKTYGRNGTLEELDRVEIYRNGVLIHTVENPVIGGTVTFTDTPETPDYYTYRVVGYNDSGRGDRECVSHYVGMGFPQMPGNVTSTVDGDEVQVKWEMPELGSFDAYLDYSDVVYDVTRYEGVLNPVGVNVAEGISEKEFTDKPDHIGKYFYSVVARNSIGSSDAAQSERTICGPAIRVPNSFTFNDDNMVQTWTIIDGNGDYDGWKQQQSGPWSFAMNSKFNAFAGYAAMEYLISPQTLLEKGKRYKVTLQAKSGSDKIAEVLAVSFGKEPTPMAQDSIAQFNIVSKTNVNLRANLPEIKETGHYHFGFVHRTAVANYDLSILGVQIEEDHDGYALVTVKDEKGNLIKGAKVSAPGADDAVADKNRIYHLDYLPAGENTVTVSALGYFDGNATVNITEWETTPVEIVLSTRSEYTLSGTVKDQAGDPVKDARVSLSGYYDYTASTDAEGRFELTGIWEAEDYNITVSKNRHLSFNQYSSITGNLDLGEIVLADNTRAPREVTVKEDSNVAEVNWSLPSNDVVNVRYDNGEYTTFVGLNAGTNETVFGTVFPDPATVHGAQFYIGSVPGVNHWNVQLYIFDLDEEGRPTSDILYKNTYVSTTDDQWNTYMLREPVEAPNGCFIAISYYGNVCIGVDGYGDTSGYPFREGMNYFSQDYRTGVFRPLEAAGIERNFMMRAYEAPYDDKAMPKFVRPGRAEREVYDGEPLFVAEIEGGSPAEPELADGQKKVLEERLRYDVYRFPEEAEADVESWTKVGEGVKAQGFTDNGWNAVERGIYKYAVKALYADGAESEARISDILGRDLHTDFFLNVFTDTEENESEGARLTMVRDDSRFRYELTVDGSGRVEMPYTWKGHYSMTLEKEGFEPWYSEVELGDEEKYDMTATLKESKFTPVGLRAVNDGVPGACTLAWNVPEMLKESFEQHQGHELFEIASPGYLGWSYRDGDEATTGGLNYEWPHKFDPMSWMTFNPDKTTPSMLADGLMPKPADGDQFILAVSSGEVANDDWIISPRLLFDEPFGLQFEAAGWHPDAAAETLEVGYSVTDLDPESFLWMTPVSLEGQVWTEFRAQLPAEARYAAIRYVSQGLYMAMIDNIKIGSVTDINMDNYGYYYPTYTVPTGDFTYEIFLNGKKHLTTKRNIEELTGLPKGHYLAAVRTVYSSGYSDMSSIEFDILKDPEPDPGNSVEEVSGGEVKVTLCDRHLTVSGSFSGLSLITPAGLSIPLDLSGSYDLTAYPQGVYMVRAESAGKVKITKIILK